VILSLSITYPDEVGIIKKACVKIKRPLDSLNIYGSSKNKFGKRVGGLKMTFYICPS